MTTVIRRPHLIFSKLFADHWACGAGLTFYCRQESSVNRFGPSSGSISAVPRNPDDPMDTSRFWPPLLYNRRDDLIVLSSFDQLIETKFKM